LGRSFGILTEKEIDGSEALIRERTGNRSLVLFDSGDEVTVQAGEEGIRFPLVSGKPLRKPVADRDEHAGPVATGAPRASGRDLH
jgi:redox-sensitive bicupin YhaK (pirin superfamily)